MTNVNPVKRLTLVPDWTHTDAPDWPYDDAIIGSLWDLAHRAPQDHDLHEDKTIKQTYPILPNYPTQKFTQLEKKGHTPDLATPCLPSEWLPIAPLCRRWCPATLCCPP